MCWKDIACIVFACVTVNHLGLIRAAIGVFFKKRETLPIVSCPKCLTFWSMMICGVVEENSSLFTLHSSLRLLAVSFLCAYLAIWLELAEGIIDKLYDYIYGKIYPTTDTAADNEERP